MPNFHLLQAYQGLAGALQAHSSGPLGHQFGINYRQPRAPLLICSLDSHIPLFGCAIARFHETQRPLDPSTLVVPSIPVDLLAADCFWSHCRKSYTTLAWCSSCSSPSSRKRRSGLTASTLHRALLLQSCHLSKSLPLYLLTLPLTSHQGYHILSGLKAGLDAIIPCSQDS